MAGETDTRQKIMKVAENLVRAGGPASLTYDAVARRVGVSKQAVIYWFPKKEDLIAGVALPSLRDEAQAALTALAGATNAAAAIAAFVRAIGQFHFSDLDRFRLMYVAPQLGARPTLRMTGSLGEQVHSLTASMYDALEVHLSAPGSNRLETRRSAVAIHMAVLGLVMLVALTEAMGDPLLHDKDDLLDTMARLLSS